MNRRPHTPGQRQPWRSHHRNDRVILMRHVPLVLTVLSCLPFLACAHHVVFERDADTQQVIPLYFDRFGDLYPEQSDWPAAFTWYGDPALRFALQGRSPGIEGELSAISAEFNKSEGDWFATWSKFQDAIWRRKEAAIARQLSLNTNDSSPRMAIIFVHGFNSDQEDSRKNYETARERLKSLRPELREAIYFDIYWDGLKGGILPPWGKAQYNAPLVGLRLRRLLNALPPEMPVRFLTHSSGGIIAASVIGNATQAFPPRNQKDARDCSESDSPYCSYARLAGARSGPYAVPMRSDLRVGMLAAATPTNSFVDMANPEMGALAPNATLIFGMNPRDEAIQKYVGADQISMIGATTMGSGGQDFDMFQMVQSELGGRNIKVFGFNFLQRKTSKLVSSPETHAFTAYLARDAFPQFVEALFDPAWNCPTTSSGLCITNQAGD